MFGDVEWQIRGKAISRIWRCTGSVQEISSPRSGRSLAWICALQSEKGNVNIYYIKIPGVFCASEVRILYLNVNLQVVCFTNCIARRSIKC